MYNKHVHEYKWFMRADDDVFVNVERLLDLLKQLEDTSAIFLGSPGYGHFEGLDSQGMLPKGGRFCMGGPGYLFSQGLLQEVGGAMGACLKKQLTPHEDVEVSRCVADLSSVTCTGSSSVRQPYCKLYTIAYQASGTIYLDLLQPSDACIGYRLFHWRYM